MKLDAYSSGDINMYLSGTFLLYKNKPIKINYLENATSSYMVMSYTKADGRDRIISDSSEVPKNEEFELTQVPMGFYPVDGTVVYLYKQQMNNYKKLLCDETVRKFLPQDRELRSIGKRIRVELDRTILKGQEFYTLEEAFEKMQDKKVFALPLHPNYAMVKKGTHKEFVIYYKTDPVITYDGTNLEPIVDQCHVKKLKLELGL